MYGSHSAGREAGDPGGGPLSAGTCHHVQAGSKVREREGRRRGRKKEGREEERDQKRGEGGGSEGDEKEVRRQRAS